ncbi:Uncharacterised protein [Mycobacterium tuberculosis]|uniref:Uncharacterized protein n=1 Tax=Mycobacterium tuberculosis TaxID=1773 RepID=A0A655JPH7_MYCTX|nr:Uncharacterised protein [Mycobacterium tuberculosis]CKV74436.1 Uncharacterised protein [Mycobacterium tuberculosis]CKV92141.1 Uncharacterised protein [Mycobacterium tuberculosis]CNV86658.1 Uncharacterised protein [Mycobacterium tuberculosis]COW57253.1 Uncharacterised protein [Mycobacterium tuberculosis]
MNLRTHRPQLVGQRFGAPATRVDHYQHGAGRKIGGGRLDYRGSVLARLRSGPQHNDPLLGEQ